MTLHGALSIPLLRSIFKSYRHRFYKMIVPVFLGSSMIRNVDWPALSLLEVVFTDFSHLLRLLEVLILML